MTPDTQFYQTQRVPSNLTRPKDNLYCEVIDQLKRIAEINEQLQEDKTKGSIFDSTNAVITQQDILTALQRLTSTLGSP